MYQPLEPCSQCRRHVQAAAVQCPFCGLERAASPAAPTTREAPRGLEPTRLSRAGLVAFAASVALAACREEPVTGPVADPAAQTPTSSTNTSPQPGPTSTAVQPAVDAGPDDPGSMHAEYGAPMPPDPGPAPKPTGKTSATGAPKPPPIAVPAYGGPAPKLPPPPTTLPKN
jgi:hypothetical protein